MANNNNLISIPGRLHDVSTNSVVSGADEIFDDVKGKRQSVINQETDAALDNKYDKNETYSKEELNNLITTPNQDYVTVPTYGSLPVTGEADTVYRVSNYDGEQSQVDATKYSEYAWDGTQYVFLCVKTQIGEVFDITAYNSNTKYADLAAALSGTNVPVGVRKGGMLVKFVQISDNKYVQCMYMGTEVTGSPNPFLDTANWRVTSEVDSVLSGSFYKTQNDAEYRDSGTTMLKAFYNFINNDSEIHLVYSDESILCYAALYATMADAVADVNKVQELSAFSKNIDVAFNGGYILRLTFKTNDGITNVDVSDLNNALLLICGNIYYNSIFKNPSDIAANKNDIELNREFIHIPDNQYLFGKKVLYTGVKYRIYLLKAGLSTYNFATKLADDTNVEVFRNLKANEWETITPQNTTEYIGCGTAGSKGGVFIIVPYDGYIEEITPLIENIEGLHNVDSLDDALDEWEKESFIGAGNNRYCFMFHVAQELSCTINSTYLMYAKLYNTQYGARNDITEDIIDVITSDNWTNKIEYTASSDGYIALTFKKSDNSAFTTEDKDDVKNNTDIFITESRVQEDLKNLREQINSETQRAQTAENALNTRINNIITGGSDIVRPIIWDCDNGWDIDDCVSARILAWGVRHKIVDLIGVVLSCNNLVNSVSAMDGLLCEEGIGECKIGAYPNSSNSYNMGYHSILASYPQHYQTESDAISDIELYRRALAQLPEGVQADVIITGYTNSFARFMQSPADSISNKTGLQLANTKIRKLWVMGGNFYDGTPELNFKTYPQDTKYILDNFTGDMYVQGHEIAVAGSDIIHAGEHLDTITSENDWLWQCLYNWNVTEGHDRGGCYAYDPMVVLAAMDDNEYATCLTYRRGIISFDTETLRTSFTESPTGNHYVASRVLLSSEYTKRLDTILNKNIWINNQSKVFRLSI